MAIAILLPWTVGLWQCANQVSPTGGPKDTKPPQIVTADPPSGTTNFSGKEIRFRFDEFIQVKSESAVSLSPPTGENPKLKVVGKRLIIELPDSLDANTTYSLDFGSELADLNEGNVTRNFIYAFSTGSEIDSLTATGVVMDAFTGARRSDVAVMLYLPGTPDTAVFKARPRYRCTSDDDGNFKFHYLREGLYRLVALADKNLNGIEDAGEEIAFADSLLRIDSSTQPATLRLFAEAGPLRVTSADLSTFGRLSVALNYPSRDATVETSPSGQCIMRSLGNDTLFAWIIPAQDSVVVKLIQSGRTVDSVEASAQGAGELEVRAHWTGDSLYVNTTLPTLQLVDYVGVTIGSESVQLPLAPKTPACVTSYIAVMPASKVQDAEIFIDRATFVSASGDSSPAVTTKLTRKAQEHGLLTLRADLTHDSLPVIIQVLTGAKDDRIVRVLTASPRQIATFTLALPIGNYRVRMISDANGNGMWDPGDFMERVQPELIVNYKQRIEVKPGWEQDIELEFDNGKRGPE